MTPPPATPAQLEVARTLTRAAWAWRVGRLAQLAEQKAALGAAERIDGAAFVAVANELHRLGQLDGEAVFAEFIKAADADPDSVADLLSSDSWNQANETMMGAALAKIVAQDARERAAAGGGAR